MIDALAFTIIVTYALGIIGASGLFGIAGGDDSEILIAIFLGFLWPAMIPLVGLFVVMCMIRSILKGGK